MKLRVLLPLMVLLAGWVSAPPARADTPEEQLAAASALFDAGKYAEAARRLDAFLAAHPKHPRAGAAALALGRARTELKQWPQAVPAYEKAVASKDPAVASVAQLGLGEAAMYAREYDKAAGALGAAVKGKLTPEQEATAWYWLGQANLELKRYAPAEKAYLKVTQDHAQSGVVDGAYFGAALAALRQGKTDAARQRLRALVDRYEQSEDRPQALFLLAQMDLDAKRYQEARSGFEALLQDGAAKTLDPQVRGAAEEGLVRTLLELKEYDAAASRLQTLLARLPATDPLRPRAQLTLGHSHYRQKQHEPALAAYREAAKAKEKAVAAEGLYWAANAALALDRGAEATALFTQLVSRFPEHPLVPKARAAMTESTTDPAQLSAALKNMPPAERARGALRLARLHLDGKKYAAAVPPLTNLLKTKAAPPVAAEAQYLLGLAYEGQEKAAPAAAALSEAVRQGADAPWMADAQTRLAWLYLEQKQPAKAEKAASAALALKESAGADVEQQARLALVQAQLDQEKWDAALEGSNALLAGSPSPETAATVLFTQAWVSEKRNKPDEALPLWERLAAEHPKSSYAAEALMHLGDAHIKAQRYEEAREKYTALLSAFPQSPVAPETRFKLGTALYNLNRYPEASGEWDAVAGNKKAGTYVPEALYWAGLALDKAGKKPDAIQRLSRLVSEYPTHTRVANAKIRLAALKAVSGG